jgi:hypothetical protein
MRNQDFLERLRRRFPETNWALKERRHKKTGEVQPLEVWAGYRTDNQASSRVRIDPTRKFYMVLRVRGEDGNYREAEQHDIEHIAKIEMQDKYLGPGGAARLVDEVYSEQQRKREEEAERKLQERFTLDVHPRVFHATGHGRNYMLGVSPGRRRGRHST